MKFIDMYKRALAKYIAQAERTHYSLADKPNSPVLTFGLLSWFRHSQEEYPALLTLRTALTSDVSDDQANAIAAIAKHFTDKTNKWNNHSFNSYFLDEIQLNCTSAAEHKYWQQFDPIPIEYFHGILFRGSGDLPKHCFQHGLSEKNTSRSLNEYISTVNGSIGVSTTKDFVIALHYALPRIDPRHDTFDSWDQSFVYIVDYQDNLGIDLEHTFLRRDQSIRSDLSAGKAEVNIIKHIDPRQIIGAFYVDRTGAIKWHHNANYVFAMDTAKLLSKFKTLLPAKFYNEIAHHYHDAVTRFTLS